MLHKTDWSRSLDNVLAKVNEMGDEVISWQIVAWGDKFCCVYSKLDYLPPASGLFTVNVKEILGTLPESET